MAKKDTSATVRDMLSTGRDLRPTRTDRPASLSAAATPATLAPAPQEPDDAGPRDAGPRDAGAGDQSPAPARSRGGRPARTAAEGDAPRTLRLAQHVANDLRAAWLEEKRNGADVLLSLQDFAGEVLADGLRARGHQR